MGVAGVIDEDVETAERADGFGDHGVDISPLSDIGCDGNGVMLANRASNILRADHVQIGDDDFGALACKQFRNAAAESRGSTRDDGDFVFKAHGPDILAIAQRTMPGRPSSAASLRYGLAG